MWELALALGLQLDTNTPSSASVQFSGHTVLQRLQKEEQLLSKVDVQFVIQQRPEPTPLGALVYTQQQCTIVINTNPKSWQQWQRLLQHLPKPSHQAAIEAAMAHELGHCMAPGIAKPNPALHTDRNTNNTNDKQASTHEHTTTSEELFADIVAMLYTQRHNAEHFEAVAQAFLLTRKNHAQLEPTHDTFKALQYAVQLQTSHLTIHNTHEKTLNRHQKNADQSMTIGQRSALLLKVSEEATATKNSPKDVVTLKSMMALN